MIGTHAKHEVRFKQWNGKPCTCACTAVPDREHIHACCKMVDEVRTGLLLNSSNASPGMLSWTRQGPHGLLAAAVDAAPILLTCKIANMQYEVRCPSEGGDGQVAAIRPPAGTGRQRAFW